MKPKIFTGVLVILLLGAIAFFQWEKRTVYNSPDAIGNSSGNILNGGLFCEYENKIYFSNYKDEGSLYSMDSNCSNFKKISSDAVSHINVAGKYIVYSRRNNTKKGNSGNFLNFNSIGIYRVNKNGKNISHLSTNPNGVSVLAGNYVYFQNYDEATGLQFYKVNIDGSGETRLSTEETIPNAIFNNILYYVGTNSEHNIHTLDLNTDTSDILVEGNYSNLIINNDYLYYTDLSQKYSIGRMALDGSNPENLVSKRCFTYNLSLDGRYLYYQVDDQKNSDKNGLYRLDLETSTDILLKEGNYHNIHTTSNYVFFSNIKDDTWFMLPTTNDTAIIEFTPAYDN